PGLRPVAPGARAGAPLDGPAARPRRCPRGHAPGRPAAQASPRTGLARPEPYDRRRDRDPAPAPPGDRRRAARVGSPPGPRSRGLRASGLRPGGAAALPHPPRLLSGPGAGRRRAAAPGRPRPVCGGRSRARRRQLHRPHDRAGPARERRPRRPRRAPSRPLPGKRPRTLHAALPGLWRILRRLWPYFRGSSLSILACLAVLLLATALRLLEPWPLKIIFDRIIRVGHGRAERVPFFVDLHAFDDTTLLALAVLAVVVAIGCRALADYAVAVGFARIANRGLGKFRADLYGHLLRLSLSFHNRSRSGDLTVRLINDVNLLRDVAVTALLPLIASVLVMVGMWSVMLWLQWKLAVLSLACVTFFW